MKNFSLIHLLPCSSSKKLAVLPETKRATILKIIGSGLGWMVWIAPELIAGHRNEFLKAENGNVVIKTILFLFFEGPDSI